MNSVKTREIDYMLESAIQAPSADNHHRVRFRLVDNAVLVNYTGGELALSAGYKRILALLSLGALSENFTIAASRFGLKIGVTLFPDSTQPYSVIRFHLLSKNVKADPLWQFIPFRHTNRHVLFHGSELNIIQRSRVEDSVNFYPTTQLIWLKSMQRKQVLHLMRLAETERFRNHLLHKELFSAIRFDVGWQNSCEEGLPPGALGVEPLMRKVFSLLRYWPVMRFANLFGAHYMFGFRACYLPCMLAPDLALLAVSSIDSQSIFDAGRSFQRLWLELTQQGKVLQPLPASALYALNGAQEDGIPSNFQYKLAVSWSNIMSKGMVPLMLCRVGESKPMAVVAGRKTVSNYR